MRLVFILPGRANSGGVRCTSIVAKGLLDRAHDVRILYQAPGLEGTCRWARDRLIGAQDWLGEFPGQIKSFRELSNCSFRIDEIIVGVGMTMSCQIGLLDVPNPRVQYIHGSTPWDPVLRDKTLRLPLPKIVVASYLKDLAETMGDGKVLAVVHNGVDFSTYYSAVSETERDGIGTIYSSGAAKDPSTVLAVIEKLMSSRPEFPVRVFGGSRRPRGLARRIYSKFPSLQWARDIYSRSLVWILASWTEGFPAPVLEAMACGCVVVATDCGGPRDQLVEGETGFLVPVGDVGKIVERVLMLMDDAKLRERIRKNSLGAVKQFTWEKCILHLEAALEKVGA